MKYWQLYVLTYYKICERVHDIILKLFRNFKKIVCGQREKFKLVVRGKQLGHLRYETTLRYTLLNYVN